MTEGPHSEEPAGEQPGPAAPGTEPAFVLHPTAPLDILASGPGARRPRRLASTTLTIAGALAVLVAGGGVFVAYRAFQALSGGGPQPEKYAPASTFAFAKLDLDPAASEKVSAYRFAKKFPSSLTDSLSNADQLRDRLLNLAFKDSSDPHIDYAHDVKPWLGSRIGAAGFIDDANKPQLLVILQVKDPGKARSSLARIVKPGSPPAYVVKSDYALLANSQSAINDALAQDQRGTLDKNAHFSDDVHALGTGQIVTAWADLAGVVKAIGSAIPLDGLLTGGLNPFLGVLSGSDSFGTSSGGSVAVPGNAPSLSPPSAACIQQLQRASRTTGTAPFSGISAQCRHELHLPNLIPPPPPSHGSVLRSSLLAPPAAPTKVSGRIALGVHVRSNYAELVMHAVGLPADKTHAASVGAQVTSLPNDTVGAIAVSGLDAVKNVFNDRAHAQLKSGLGPLLSSMSGLDVNIDDLLASLGNSLVVSIGNVPDDHTAPLIGLRTQPADKSAARRVVAEINRRLSAEPDAPTLVTRNVGDDLIVADFPSYLNTLAQGGHLGDQKSFQQAVGPLDGTVVALGYVDLRRVLAAAPDHGGPARNLTAAGLTVVKSGTSETLRLRLVAG